MAELLAPASPAWLQGAESKESDYSKQFGSLIDIGHFKYCLVPKFPLPLFLAKHLDHVKYVVAESRSG